ncbi:MAG: family 43 glycosylhydrolase [Clostridia bacterium]|nr:family 43 glycosylhydrolase [Clostridia bacterium]
MKKRITALAACALISFGAFAGCKEEGATYNRGVRAAVDKNEITYTLASEDYETYYNFIEHFDGDGDVYEVGDPYVFRHDGKYYLYTSLNGNKRFSGKIPCWVSENLVDWDWAGWAYGGERTGTENDENFETYIAFAPEVVYYQGWFWMCESRRGNGHYFFRSKNPNGPFELVTDNLLQNIDGSFYLANDGQLYFMSALVTGIGYMKVNIEENEDGSAKLTLDKPTIVPEATLSNMWTEGPGYFSRNGYNYLTFTGNHVDSAGYRVGYAYTTSDFLYEGLNTHYNNVTLVSNGEDTDPIYIGYNGNLSSAEVQFSNYRGTGHSSNVVGPNLDSIYTAYHTARRINYNNLQEGSQRKYNVTRYYTNGGYVMADSLANFNVAKPALPDYTGGADALKEENGVLLSEKATGAIYTAELNFVPADGKADIYVGYTDKDNYTKITLASNRISVVKTTSGKASVIGGASVVTGSNAEAVHTVKVVNGAYGSEVYFDNMLKLESDHSLGGGKVGYGSNTTPSATEFTNDAFGTSDFEAIKNLTGSFPAYAYAKGQNRGWSIKGAKASESGIRQGEPEKTKLTEDGYAVELAAGDWVKYNVNAPEQGWYDLSGLISKESQGAILEVVIDNEKIYRLDIDKTSFGDAEYMEMSLGRFFIDEGMHTMKIRVFSGKLSVKQFSTERYAQEIGAVEESFTQKPEDLKTLIGYAYYQEKGMVVNEYIEKTMAYWGNRGMTDYEFEVDVNLPPRTIMNGSFGGGILFRTKNFHHASNAKVPANPYGWQGYFLYVSNTGVMLYKCNFSQKQIGAYDLEGTETFFGNGEKSVRIGVRAYHSEITISINGEQVISFVDVEQPFTSGYIGFYGSGSEMICSNFKFKEI